MATSKAYSVTKKTLVIRNFRESHFPNNPVGNLKSLRKEGKLEGRRASWINQAPAELLGSKWWSGRCLPHEHAGRPHF